MKKSFLLLAFIFSITLVESCNTIQLVELPTEIPLGECKVYMNEEEVNYPITIRHDTFQNFLNFAFVETKENGNRSIVNTLGFGFLPLSVDTYILHTDRIIHKGAYTGFSQTIEEDSEGYSYKMVNEENGYFEIISLDLDNRTVSGKFKASFKRTSKNWNNGLELPKNIIFQGIFHKAF